MFFRKERGGSGTGPSGSPLADVIRRAMPDADDESLRIVTAVAGLLAAVAYVDRDYADDERVRVREELGRIHDLPAAGVEAVCALFDERIVEVAASNMHGHTRDLRELCDPEMRREVLDVLVDLAAADDRVTLAETDLLRRVTAALGLTPDDYLAAQDRHRHRLSLLDGSGKTPA